MTLSTRAPLVLLALALTVLEAAPARAAAFLEVAGDPSAHHPLLGRVVPIGPANAYLNPALLTEFPNTVLVGPFAWLQRLDVRLDARLPGSDVPAGADSDALPTAGLPAARGSARHDRDAFYMAQGNVTRLLDGRLAMGFYLLTANDAFSPQRPFFVDEREQFFSNSLHFERYGERLEAVEFAFGVGGKPLEWLAIGAGISLAFVADSGLDVYVADAKRPEGSEARAWTDLRIKLVPHFAIAATPLEGLRVTSTVHLGFQSDASTSGRLEVRGAALADGTDTLVREVSGTHGFEPLRVSLGASYTGGDPDGIGYLAAASVLWARWSTYRDRQGEDAAGPDWSDTFTVVAGGDFLLATEGAGHHAFGLDLLYAPTPVPAQTGRTSYVDNDRFGFAIAWDGSWNLGAVTLVSGVQLEVQRLLPRHVTKRPDAKDPVVDEAPETPGLQTNNPGWPGFASEGWLIGVGASLRIQF